MEAFDPGLWLLRIVIFCLGASMGSFLVATAYRIPRGISLLRPSQCTKCGKNLPWYGLLPIVGVLVVKKKCTVCGSPVSLHYALFELCLAILTLVVFEVHVDLSFLLNLLAQRPVVFFGSTHWGFVGPLVVSLWLLYTGATLSLIDLEFRILPNVITLPGIVVGLVFSAFDPGRGFLFGLWGVLAGAGGLWAVAVAYQLIRGRDGMGMGDVKYLGFIGAVLGWSGVLWTLLLASVVGSVVGVTLGIARSLRSSEEAAQNSEATVDKTTENALQTAIPFGPFLAAGAFLLSLYPSLMQTLLFGVQP